MPGKAGYEYLAAYKLSVVLEDYVNEFCHRCKSSEYHQYPALPSYRSYDQIIQAARSGSRNIPEGFKQQSLKGYIKLATNLLLTLINQENYLLDKLIDSLKRKHQAEGGFTEKLYRARKDYRGY